MESFVHDYITSSYSDDLAEDLEKRLSPYATLRPGDLAALLRIQAPLLPLVNTRFSCSNHDGDFPVCKTLSTREVDGILEEHQPISVEDENKDGTSGREGAVDIVCRGSDTNDSPAEYTVKGLHHHEIPVIGVYVDPKICPGFRYLVRRVGCDGFFFNNKPKTLISIGMGYGKRITFSGDSLNNNDCFFWSDSEPNGYAFSIHAVDIGQRFSIVDPENVIVGEAVLEEVIEPQEEISSVADGKTITKHVKVMMICSTKYYQRHNHGLVEIMAHEDLETVTGEVVLIKNRSDRTAKLSSIEQVFLQRFGFCKLEPES